MAIPYEHLARFYGIKDAMTLWAGIKTIFGGNAESKKMQKNVLKQQFEIFLSNISLIMRNKPCIDNLDIDDLYKILKVYEADIKGSSGSSSNSYNAQGSSSYADEFKFVFSANQFSTLQLDKADLEHIDQDNLEEIDLKWDYKSARNSQNRSKDAGNAGYRGRDNGKRPAKEGDEQALVVQDGLGTYDWSYQVEEEATDFALIAFTSNLSSSSSSNSKREKLNKANIEIIGYDSQFNEKEVLDIKEEEVTETVFDNRSSDEKNSVANDRFKKSEGYHAVPPPLTGNYMPPKPDLSFAGLDDSICKFKISETVTSLAKDEKDALETSTACIEKHKEDRMAKKSVLTSNVGKGTGHKESIPVWNNGQRINHPNKFAPTTVFTRSDKIPVSAAKPKAAASTSVAKPVNTVWPKQSVNFSKKRSSFHKSHSPIRRSFYNVTAHSRRNLTERINTAGSKAVSTVKGNEVTAVKTLTGCIWRPRVNAIDQLSKDNRWICTYVDYGHLRQALKNKGIVDSGCSRHMTGNKAYLADYQEIHDGGELTFFLGLQVKQSEEGIFISQDTYVAEILKKFNFSSVKTASTPIQTQKPLVKDKNQMLDYGFNFMNTKIYIENESIICIVKNLVYHSKIKHIKIRHHFIRDSYEKKLIHVLKIHTDDNVADLLTKAFDVSRFNFLKANIGMLNM
uniref:Putative ribonuclease H-like domain-containing protein n=1 Tax=Tanacetum cinerariifolium TaxID=118510 RepID=A0A6L2KNL2_TANCI|nr:putative ribonuclease H-like domain-containing protein [Tanacetum cinerariifolium]